MKNPFRQVRPAWWIVPALLVLSTPLAAQEQTLVEFGTSMKYRANASDPGISGLTWTLPGYSDASWSTGAYGVGYDNAGDANALLQTHVGSGRISVYTRATFNVADVSEITNLYLGVDYDDGYVAWINGVEVARSPTMPSGTPSWNTATDSQSESSNGPVPDYTPYENISVAGIPALQDGSNTLAIGVWNRSFGSSDLVLVPRLVANGSFDLTRGPYLQIGTPDSVVVRWRTESLQTSRVVYGTTQGSLGSTVQSFAAVTEHELTLTGLAPDTKYYYAIGDTSSLLAGDDADHFFVTSPPTGASGPVRIWAIGDSGTGTVDQFAVRDAYETFTGATHTDLWLMLGDNAYNSGTDVEYQQKVFNVYREMLRKSVLWPTLGNHDAFTATSSSQSGPYYDIFTLPQSGQAGGVVSGTEAYYSFDYGNIHFVVLDSADSDRGSGGDMLTWLEADLDDTEQDWVIAFWHHPPYSRGNHNSDNNNELEEMRENALPVLEARGVDLVLGGHSHSYERSYLIDGHYGDSNTLVPSMILDGGDGQVDGDGAYSKPNAGINPHEGAVFVVAGSSGKTQSGGSLNHPVMHLSLLQLGSLVLDVNANEIRATFLGHTGNVLDRFTIRKPGSPPPIPTGAAATDPMRALRLDPSGSQIEVSWDDRCSPIGTKLLYGPLDQVSFLGIGGSVCGIAAPAAWDPVPAGDLWFLVVADDGVTTEGSWGQSSTGERTAGVASNECGHTAKDASGACP